jgi:hypothetical protein
MYTEPQIYANQLLLTSNILAKSSKTGEILFYIFFISTKLDQKKEMRAKKISKTVSFVNNTN